MNFSFIHTADLHLDRAFSDVTQIPEKYNNAGLRAFQNLVDYATEKKVNFILIAGDTFDSETPDFQAKLKFKKYIDELDKAGIKVFMICGNHDPLRSYSRITFNYENNQNIKIAGLNTPSAKEDFIVCDKDNKPCALIHALSFTTKEFKENPVSYFKTATPEEKKLFNIGLLHCDLNGEKGSPYAPCTVTELKNLNYDYFALGHIHIPPMPEENIFYAGTIQGRNSKECGSYGFRHITVTNGFISENKFIPSDIVRYINADVDISELSDPTEIENKIIVDLNEVIDNEKFYFVNINLKGDIPFYEELRKDNFKISDDIRTDINTEHSSSFHISEINNKTTPRVNKEYLIADTGIIGKITEETENTENIDEIMQKLERKYLNDIKQNFNIEEEEYEKIKNEIINEAKQTCISICGCLYNNEKED